MKKLIVMILFAIPMSRGFAQLTLTPEIGYNKMIFNNNASGTQIVTSPLSGFQIGGLVTKFWAKHLFIQSGLQFAQKGSYDGMGYQALYGSNSNVRVSYLQVPLNVGASIKLPKGFGLVIAGGLYAAYGLGGTEKGTAVNINGSTNTIDRKISFASNPTADNSKTYVKPFDFGYNLSGGFTWHDFVLKTTYSLGFKSLYPLASSTVYKNEIWNFSVGRTFKIK
jgi:hypothetical protein